MQELDKAGVEVVRSVPERQVGIDRPQDGSRNVLSQPGLRLVDPIRADGIGKRHLPAEPFREATVVAEHRTDL